MKKDKRNKREFNSKKKAAHEILSGRRSPTTDDVADYLSSGQPLIGGKVPPVPKKAPNRTRSATSSRAILQSINDMRASERGALDAKHECGSESDDEPDSGPLNPDASPSEPDLNSDRYHFVPASSVHKLPVAILFLSPLIWCAVRIMAGEAFFGPVAIPVVLLVQLAFILLATPWLRERRYLRFFRPSLARLPPSFTNIQTTESFCEAIHMTPEYASASSVVCGLLYLIQPVSAFFLPLQNVVSGATLHVGRSMEETTTVDHRLPCHQGSAKSSERVSYDRWVVVSFSSGLSSLKVSCETVVRQIVPRLLCLSASDRALQAIPMATRVSSTLIKGKYFPEVARGSAHTAKVHCDSASVSEGIYELAGRLSPISVDIASVYTVLLFLACFIPNARHTGSILDQGALGVVTALFIAPWLEEFYKEGVSRFTGVSRVWVSAAFGFAELALSGFSPLACPAFIMHCCVGLLPLRHAIGAHFSFNLAVVLLAWSFQNPQPHQSRRSWSYSQRSSSSRKPGDNTNYQQPRNQLSDNSTHPWHDVEFVNHLCSIFRNPYFYFSGELQDKVFTHIHWFNPWIHCAAGSSLALTAVGLIAVVVCGVHKRGIFSPTKSVTSERRHAVGYRFGEVPISTEGEHDATVKAHKSFWEFVPRASFCSSLGFTLKRIVPPFPDFAHPITALHGCLMRFCKVPPEPKRGTLRRLRRFVLRYVKTHYTPIPADADTSVETWLDGTGYPAWRKEQLRQTWAERPWVEPGDETNKSFMKKEHYGSYKPSRGINSRTDTFKCATGPYFKLMESQVYEQPCYADGSLGTGRMGPFIKHIPTHLRPRFLELYLGDSDGPYYETDYSQFEKHFTPRVMNALEMVLYKHMLKNHPAVYDLIRKSLSGTNKCVFKHFTLKVKARRMSGDMCTSLGNGFSNLMLLKFAAYSLGGRAHGVVEGDDALFVSTVPLSTKDFEDLGFTIKLESFPDLYSTSFCGMLMSRDGILLRDIARVIPKFGWSFSQRRLGGPRVVNGLLRARALSLAYESPRCPIIHALAKRALAVTFGWEPIFECGHHDREVSRWAELFGKETLALLELGPSEDARADYFTKFGIPPSVQLEVESRISRWNGEPLDDPLVNELFHTSADMRDFSERYVASDLKLIPTFIGDQPL